MKITNERLEEISKELRNLGVMFTLAVVQLNDDHEPELYSTVNITSLDTDVIVVSQEEYEDDGIVELVPVFSVSDKLKVDVARFELGIFRAAMNEMNNCLERCAAMHYCISLDLAADFEKIYNRNK